MIEHVLHTRDGLYRVYLYDDQTGELADSKGRRITDRIPLYRLGRELADLGYAFDDLVTE